MSVVTQPLSSSYRQDNQDQTQKLDSVSERYLILQLAQDIHVEDAKLRADMKSRVVQNNFF